MDLRKRWIYLLSILALSLACSTASLSGLVATSTPVPTNTPAHIPSSSYDAVTETTESAPATDQTIQQNFSPLPVTSEAEVVVTLDNRFEVNGQDYIVGLVQNNTHSSIQWVKISLLLYDVQQNLIATEIIYPFLNIIPAGTTAPFSYFSNRWSEAASHEFVVDWEETSDLPPAGLELANFTSYNDDFYLYVIGEVHNTSETAVGWVKIAAILYAEDNTLLSATYTYSMLKYLQPGGSSPFKIWLKENWADAERYEIQVQGTYDDTISEYGVEVLTYRLTEEKGRCAVEGNLKNNGAEELSYATVVVAFYDAQRNLIDAVWNLSDSSIIPAGGIDTFEVIALVCPVYSSFEVFASK